jgi:hypothetical protein
MRKLFQVVCISLALVSCKEEEETPKISANSAINLTTSYYVYEQPSNFLYTDMSTIFQSVHGGYFTHEFSARAFYDFDKDGDLDVIAATFMTDQNSQIDAHYYKNNEGTFQKDQSVFNGTIPAFVHARQAILGDFDSNGWMDVAIIAHGYDKDPFPGEKQKLLMNFNGKFTTKEVQLLPTGRLPYTHSGCSGDIDNDGDVDLFYTSNMVNVKGIFMKNDGSGNFTYDAHLFPSEIIAPYFASGLYDLNQDGYLDLVITGQDNSKQVVQDPQASAKPTILWGNPTGKYTLSNSTLLPVIKDYGVTYNVNFLDFNKDSKVDIVLTKTGDGAASLSYYQGYYLQLLMNNGGNSFTDVTTTSMGSYRNDNVANWILWLRPHDIDGDGDIDITSEDKFEPHEWINNNGTFAKR